MPAAEIGASFSNNANPALGGGGFGSFQLDTKPIEDLARYTMLYNKSLFDQRQKDADEKILELAKIADININDLRGKDKEELIKQVAAASEAGREYAGKTPETPKEKVEQYLAWKKQVLDVSNNHISGKARSIKYVKELDAINVSTDDAKTKAVKIKQLDEIFDKTPISEQFGNLPQYETSTIDIPKPVGGDVMTVAIGDNEDVVVEGKIFNPKENLSVVHAIEIGVAKLYPAKGTPEYNNLSEDEKKQADVQGTIESKAKVWADMAAVLTSALQSKDNQGNLKYYTKDSAGNLLFDEVKFKKDNASNTLLMGNFNTLKEMSEYSKKKITGSQGGIFEDKNFKYKLPTSINPDGSDFLPGVVDFNSGEIKSTQLIMAGIYAQFGGDKFEKKLQLTGDKIQRGAQDVQRRGQNIAAGTAANSLAESKRQFDITNPTGIVGNTSTTGNAFDEIGGTTDIKFGGIFSKKSGKISDGFVYDKSGKLLTGEIEIPADQLPASMISALRAAGTGSVTEENADGKLVTLPIPSTGVVKVNAKNGEIISVKATGGPVISRQAMENAQKKFDTEQKGQQRTQWGRTNVKPNTAETTSPQTETPEERIKRLFPNQ